MIAFNTGSEITLIHLDGEVYVHFESECKVDIDLDVLQKSLFISERI